MGNRLNCTDFHVFLNSLFRFRGKKIHLYYKQNKSYKKPQRKSLYDVYGLVSSSAADENADHSNLMYSAWEQSV